MHSTEHHRTVRARKPNGHRYRYRLQIRATLTILGIPTLVPFVASILTRFLLAIQTLLRSKTLWNEELARGLATGFTLTGSFHTDHSGSDRDVEAVRTSLHGDTDSSYLAARCFFPPAT